MSQMFRLGWVLLGTMFLAACSCGAGGRICTNDTDCAKGEICTSETCAAGCRTKADCEEGLLCVSGKCTTLVCVVGSQRACASVGETGKQVGLCSDGTEVCGGGGASWGKCSGIGPQRESCDRLDNDCDGKVDEANDGSDLPCECTTPGSIRLCYSGPPGTHTVGTCAAGVQYCTAGYVWGKCHDVVLPKPEACDAADNDCDGKVDEGITCDCTAGEQRPCYPGSLASLGRGACKQGKQICGKDLKWGKCEGMTLPSPEENHGCNATDDDCDGNIDERADGLGVLPACLSCADGNVQDCYNGPLGAFVGVCKQGQQTCKGGTWGKCEGEILPSPEVCGDKLDNDCDGSVDEACPAKACQNGEERGCYDGPNGTAGYLPCKVGRQSCAGGKWGSCKGQILPAVEVCKDQKDNDCDGRVDEDCNVPTCAPNGKEEPCYTGIDVTRGVGSCKAGKRLCRFGHWTTCVGEILPAKDSCDGKDDDCNGIPDTGCDCKGGETRQCFPATIKGCTRASDGSYLCHAPCKAGTQTCAKGTWETDCKGAVIAEKESCNDKDDDCDGKIDGFQRACYSGLPEEVGKGECSKGSQLCENGTWSKCLGEIKPQLEVCDGKDNNCNGLIDENDPKLNGACIAEGRQGPCRDGIWLCKKGALSCVPGYQQKEEDCANGIDDDCDGIPDGPPCACQNGKSRSCYSGPANTKGKGACVAGTQRCASGKWSACVGERLPEAEICDNKDNDCNGKIDDLLRRNCFSGAIGCSLQTNGTYKCIPSCRSGTQVCSAGKWGTCAGETKPTAEVCDGLDNNCDGLADNNLKRNCSTACGPGQETCVSARWSSCSAGTPSVEVCNNKDDDCDGQIDNNLQRACYSVGDNTHKYGLCKKGKETCQAGRWGSCLGEVIPTLEICNNKDDDCDGGVDESLKNSCYSGGSSTRNKGICRDGISACNGGVWGNCLGEILPTTETCDGKDNDCNGNIDDNAGCVCTNGSMRPCGSNVGLCIQGYQTCVNQKWGACTGATGPAQEICDMQDNDCDGQIDEDFPTSGQSCGGGVGPCQFYGMLVCKSDHSGVECSNKQTVFPQKEVCDSIDNDCNGLVDDGVCEMYEPPDGGGVDRNPPDLGGPDFYDAGPQDTGPVPDNNPKIPDAPRPAPAPVKTSKKK